MSTYTTTLKAKQVAAAKPRDKDYVLSDGGGLQLRVRTNGSRLWNFNYRHPISKKRVNIGLGSYPEISLAQAREKTKESRALVAQGNDPKAHRDKEALQRKLETSNTLRKVAEEWIELKKSRVTADHAADSWKSLEIHIFPKLAHTPITDVSAPQVIDVLRPIEAKGSLETVKRLCQRLNEIMTHATNSGYLPTNPLSGIREAFQKPKKKNMPTIKPEELPELVQTIANASIKRVTRLLIEWQLHTMTRPSEAAGARWEEIDFEKQLWTIPAERMKKRKEHIVPLTEQSLALLEALKPISGHREHLFPSDRNPRTHTNSQTANMALKRMGYGGKLVSHGLRALASTVLNEMRQDRELIEVCLAHVDSSVRRDYNRADYLEARRQVMMTWSQEIEKASVGSLSASQSLSLKVVNG